MRRKIRQNQHILLFPILVGLILLLAFTFPLIQKKITKPEVFPKAEIVLQKKEFKAGEKVEFILNLHDNSIRKVLGPKQALAEESNNLPENIYVEGNTSIKAKILYDKAEIKSVPITITKQNEDTYLITAYTPDSSFRPGQYKLDVEMEKDGLSRNITQNFNWGVLAINTNKSIYSPNEEAKIYFGVLNDFGTTVCDAVISLKITNPDGQTDLLSTQNDRIKYSGECGRDNVTYVPDYQAIYKVGAEGDYQMEVTAKTANGEYKINDVFKVDSVIPYDIERISPTRINPSSPYISKIKITALEDFTGEIIEKVPASFKIEGEGFTQTDQNPRSLIWKTTLIKGQTKEFSYTYDAPDISPEFYLLGPIQLSDISYQSSDSLESDRKLKADDNVMFSEARQWQIANDGVGDVILLWDGGTPPAGWTCISCSGGQAYYQIYPRGAAAYSGSTGGAANHNHTISYVSESTSGDVADWDSGTGSIYVADVGHTHGGITSPNVVSASNDPSNRTLKFIQSSGTPTTIPNGVIGMFDTTSLPTNWQAYSSQDTYFLKGDGSIGTGGSNSHTHDETATSSNTNSSYQLTNTTGANGTTTTHNHSCSGTSDSQDHQPPYVEVVFAQTTQDTTVPAGLIAMFDATPPNGWDSVSDAAEAFNGKFIKGDSSTPGGTGGNTNHPTHSNLGLSCSQTTNTISADTSPNNGGSALAHTHTITVSHSSNASVPVYRDTIFGQKTPEVTGTIYNGNGTVYDCSANNLTVAVSKNGAAPVTGTCNSAGGTYAIGITATAAGDVLTVFLDDETPNASTITKASGTSGATSIDLYVDHMIVRHENAAALTNQELNNYDYVNGSSDGDVPFQVDLSGTYNLTVRSGTRLLVWTGKTFDPGGTVTTDATGGDLIVGASATAYLDTATSSIGKDIIASGSGTLNIQANVTVGGGDITTTGTSATITYTNTPTLTLRGTGSIGGGTTPSVTFYSLTVGDGTTATTTTSTSFTVANAFSVGTGSSFTGSSSTLTMSGGSISNSGTLSFNGLTISGTTTTSSSFTITGALTVGASGNLSPSGGTITMNGGSISNSNTLVFSGLTISGTPTTSSSFSVGGALTVNGGANFSPSGGTVTMNNGSSITNSGTLAFQNLTIAASASVTTASTFSVVADLTVNASGTLSTTGGTGTITVNGNVAGTGTLTISHGTFEQRVSAAKNFGTSSGASNWSFTTLIFSNGGGAGYTISTQTGGSGTITVSTLLQIGKVGDGQPTTLDAGNRTWNLTSTTGTPFDIIGSSVLTGNTSTFSYNGNNGGGDTTVQSTTGSSYYYNLTFNAADNFVPEGALIINNDLTITTGTLAMGANNLTVGTDSTAGDISVATSQSLTQSASGTTTVKTFNANTGIVGGAGTLTFYNLSLSPTNSGGTIRLGSAAGQTISVLGTLTAGNGTNTVTVDANTNDPTINVTYDLTINTNATFQATSGNLTIGGNFANSNVFTHASGTVIMNAGDTGNTLSGTMTGASSFNNLQFNNASGAWSFGANAATIANNFTITSSAAGGVTAPSTTLTITGNYSNSGTFVHNNGLVLFNAADTGNTLSGTMTGTSSFYNLEFSNASGAWSLGANSATVTNNFTITNTTGVGGVTAPSTTLTIGGNFTKTAGTFSHNNGTVTFNDNTKISTLTYNAATDFYALTSSTASKELHFDNDAQTNVTNNFTINGGACGTKIRLYSDSTPNRWEINVTGGTKSIQYAEIGDSAAIVALTATNSTSLGNSTGWTITGDSCGGVTVSGNAYTDEGTSVWGPCDGNTNNISLVVNGGGSYTATCDDTTGAFAFYTVSTAVNNPVSVFFNTNGGNSDKGVAVTVAANGSSNIILNPRLNRVWVTTETGITSISNANLDHCDSGSPAGCANVPYSVTTNALTVISGVELHVQSSKIYDPNGTVTTNATGGDLHIDDGATTYLDTATSAIGRDILVDASATLNVQATTTVGGGDITTGNSATVTYTNTPTVTISGSGNIGGGTAPSITFYNLTISGTQTGTSPITVANDLTANGTLQGSQNVTVNGTVAGTGTINLSGGTFEQRVSAAENFGITSGSNAWTFATLIFSNGGGAGYTVTTQAGGTGGITVSTLLQIGKVGDGQTTALNAGNRTWTLSSTTGTPFDIIGSSSLTGGTSTFTYTGIYGSGNTTVQTATYNNLTINAAETYAAEGTISVNGDLTITTGTLSMGSNDLNVGSTGVANSGNIAVAGSLTQTSGTATVRTSAAGTATIGGAGTLTFYNLAIAPDANGGAITLGSAAGQTITTNNLTIGNDTNTVTVNATTYDPTLDVNGSFLVNTNGTFQASNTGTFTIADDFTNDGTFTHNSGEVTFDTTTTSDITGAATDPTPAITFFNFKSITAGKTLQFGVGKVIRIEGLITITGTSPSKITIKSTSDNSQWKIDHQGTEDITNAIVRDSGHLAGSTNVSLDPTDSDGGNNSSVWQFQIGKRIKANVRFKSGVRIK